MLARPPKVQYPRSRWHVSCAAFVSLLPPCDLLDALGRSASYCKRHMARKRTHEESPCLQTSSRHWQTTLLFGPAVIPDALLARAIYFLCLSFYEIIFGWQNPCHISNPEFGDVHFILWFLWGYEHQKGVYQNLEKTSKSVYIESFITMEGWVILPLKSH